MGAKALPHECKEVKRRVKARNAKYPDEPLVVVRCAGSIEAFVKGIRRSCRRHPKADAAYDHIFLSRSRKGLSVPPCER